MPGQKATLNGPATIRRHALRLNRIRQALGRAKGERKASLEAEAHRLQGELAGAKEELEAALAEAAEVTGADESE